VPTPLRYGMLREESDLLENWVRNVGIVSCSAVIEVNVEKLQLPT